MDNDKTSETPLPSVKKVLLIVLYNADLLLS